MFARCVQKCTLSSHLIAGNALEPCTTIASKVRYDGWKTQGLAVHAGKLLMALNECTENLQRLSPDREKLISQQEYGASKGVGENPLNGKGAP